jgi:hypothetical protein
VVVSFIGGGDTQALVSGKKIYLDTQLVSRYFFLPETNACEETIASS